MLTDTDLPGYTTDPPDPNDDPPPTDAAVNACVNNNALFVQLGEDTDPRGAVSPDFSKGDEITVGPAVTFAGTEDEARAAGTAFSATTFPTRFSNAITAELRKDPDFTNVTATTARLPATTAGDQAVGYRSTTRFRVSGTAVTVYADLVLIRSGRGLAGIQRSSFSTPFPEAERTRLVAAVAGRRAAP